LSSLGSAALTPHSSGDRQRPGAADYHSNLKAKAASIMGACIARPKDEYWARCCWPIRNRQSRSPAFRADWRFDARLYDNPGQV